MKRKFLAPIIFFASSAIVIAFQNCAQANFETAQVSANEKGLPSNTSAINPVTGGDVTSGSNSTPAIPTPVPTALPGGSAANPPSTAAPSAAPLQIAPQPEAPGVCYDVTCTSDAWGMKTLTGTTNQQGVVTSLAPSTGSTWVISINSQHKIYSYLNCFPNEITASTPPDFYNSSLCSLNAPQSANLYSRQYFPNGPTFTQGAGRYMRGCEQTPCGFMKTDSRTDADGHYQWISGTLNKTTGAAVVKIRFVDYGGHFDPSRVSADFMVSPGACSVQSMQVYDSATNQIRQMSYQVCLDQNKVVTVTSAMPTATVRLDLSGLTNLSSPVLVNTITPSTTRSASSNVCSFTMSGGGSGSTSGSNLSACHDWCALNAKLNPGVVLSCRFNGTPVAL